LVSQHEHWRELGQQLRVDSIRAVVAAGSGHPTSSMSAADLMAVLLAKYLRYDFDRPAEPLNGSPDFLEGSRVAVALLAGQGCGCGFRR
jgi:transketolase